MLKPAITAGVVLVLAFPLVAQAPPGGSSSTDIVPLLTVSGTGEARVAPDEATVRLGLVASNDLDQEEVGDLVELAADGRIAAARSPLGSYLVRHWERIALVDGESLVYWLRKLVFRGAYLDHRVKEGLLEISWDDDSGEFAYAEPHGGRALLELAPTPSWHTLQYRR